MAPAGSRYGTGGTSTRPTPSIPRLDAADDPVRVRPDVLRLALVGEDPEADEAAEAADGADPTDPAVLTWLDPPGGPDSATMPQTLQ